MDISWILVVLALVAIFTSISVTGALRRIADATEKTAADVEELLQAAKRIEAQP